MGQAKLVKPGLIVNWLKGDPAETRANTWLEWDGSWDLEAVYLGIPFDGAGTVRSGSRHAPDEVRRALPFYTSYSAGGADAIYISIDVDGVDQSSAPGTAAPNPFGIDGRDVIMAVRKIARHPKCFGMEITELSPPLDVNHMTSNWAAVVFMNFFYGLAVQKRRSEH